MRRIFLFALALGFVLPLFSQTKVNIESEFIDIQDQSSKIINAENNDVLYEGTTNSKGIETVSFELETTTIVRYSIGSDKGFILVLNPDDNLEIKADYSDFTNTQDIKGSEENNKIYKFLASQQADLEVIDSLVTAYGASKDSEEKGKIVEQYNTIKIFLDSTSLIYIKENQESLTSILLASDMDKDKYLKDLFEYAEIIYAKYPDITFVKDFYISLAAIYSTAIGSEAPEIELEGPDGVVYKLSDLKGKVVIIDFWASWCSPCRRENPNMVKIYEKYRDAGLEIYGVSLDKSKDKWVAAIESDKLTWTHVSDLQYWNSAAAKLYGVKSIPATFLLDRNGVILHKNLRGVELEAVLEEIFGF